MSTATIAKRPKNEIVVYLCGGTGADIASVLLERLKGLNAPDVDNLGILRPVLVDTSASNLNESHTGIPFFHLKQDGREMDGGGKIMNTVFNVAKNSTADIVEATKPGRFTLVVGNMGGGSGSGISVALMRELAMQGKDAIMIGIAACESKTVLDNTNRSLNLLKGVSETYNRTVVLSPFTSEGTSSFRKVNTLVAQSILMLGVLLSNNNARCDTADLVNWMNFEKPLRTDPDLVGLYFHTGTEEIPQDVVPLTVATLTGSADEEAATGYDLTFQSHGIIPSATGSEIFTTTPAHFIVASGVVESIQNSVHERSSEMARSIKNRPAKTAFVGKVDMDGMDV